MAFAGHSQVASCTVNAIKGVTSYWEHIDRPAQFLDRSMIFFDAQLRRLYHVHHIELDSHEDLESDESDDVDHFNGVCEKRDHDFSSK